MPTYSMRDVQRVLRLSPDTTRNLIKAGFVKPTRGARREYRFSFQDLIVLRTARALIDAKVPTRRIRRSLESLRRELPESVPLSGLSISAIGEQVVVRDGDIQRQVDSGQYLLGLEVSIENGVLRVVEHREAAPAPPAASAPNADWFTRALTLESTDPEAALTAWGHAVDEDAANAAAWTNWGRLLHEQGRTQQAAEVYRRALARVGPDPLLLYNQGVLLEDLGDATAALAAYQSAIAEDP
ncbi:MAG TPA: tetratricopeptide repeat protein, partial [Steroidobacteraceae bacterium]